MFEPQTDSRVRVRKSRHLFTKKLHRKYVENTLVFTATVWHFIDNQITLAKLASKLLLIKLNVLHFVGL